MGASETEHHWSGTSEASFHSGAQSISARSSHASSLQCSDRDSAATLDRERPHRVKSSYHSSPAASYRDNRRGSALSTWTEEGSNDVCNDMNNHDRRRSAYSDVSSSLCSPRIGARFPGGSRAATGKVSAQSSCVSDVSSCASGSTACSSSYTASKGGRDGQPSSTCSQNSFSFGGFSFDKVGRRSSPQ